MECITIEVSMGNKKNIILSCIYRTPGSNIDIFIEKIEHIFSKSQKQICINPKMHKSTEDFVNVMYSMGLVPRITKPSRITTNSVTVIDNIFTNTENCTVSRLLYNIKQYYQK